ncbi:hypothetical protein BB558_001097 [Smittium angustum]|uniref:Uncharacterized protein n=1 Tax=Smittium angustum TaxID=133377 RepID=A0A2U1JCP6_SMIAN|nr:hypothetical protein BB558_003743 [Smittium angustum]PWA02758.1 hypothetical protein BB558_001097 [Smittium angustum]
MSTIFSVQKNIQNAHEDSIWNVIWSPLTNKIITSSVDETIKIWNGESLQLEGVLKGLDFAIISIDLSKKEDKILSTTMGHFIEVWDIESSNVLKRINAGPINAWNGRFVNNDELVICGSDKGTLSIWNLDLADNKTLKNKNDIPVSILDTTKKEMITALSTDSLQEMVVAGSESGSLYIFDLETSQAIGEFTAHSDTIRKISHAQNNDVICSCSDDKRMLIYDPRYKTTVMSFQEHEGWVMSTSFGSKDTTLSSASADGTVKLWDLRNKGCFETFSAHSSEVWDVSWENSENPKLVSVGDDKTVQIYAPASS